MQSTEGAAQPSAPPPTRHFIEDKVGLMAHSQSCLQSSQQVARVANETCTDTITRIKLDAVNQAFRMLAQGLLPFQIVDFMGGPISHVRPHTQLLRMLGWPRLAIVILPHLRNSLDRSCSLLSKPALSFSHRLKPQLDQRDASEPTPPPGEGSSRDRLPQAC